ncbi:MAG TPA: hypothetical protein VGF20_07045 [Candidatus Acidoferrum sp.]|jgi:hypothetical protein
MKVYLIETAEPVEQQFECGIAQELILYIDRADAEAAAAAYNLEFESIDQDAAYVAEIEVRPKGYRDKL